MKGVLHRVLLASADSGIAWFPWNRLRPERRQRLGFGVVLLHVVSGFVWAGVPFLLLSRGFLSRWSLPAFLIPGAFGGLAAALWFGMIRLAWNRRASECASSSVAGQASIETAPLSSLERWILLPVLGLVVLIAAGSLVVAIENVRGIWLLRSVENDFRQRGLPVALEEVAPPPVPDERNFALAPILKPLFDYQVAVPVRGQTNVGSVHWNDLQAFSRIQEMLRVEAQHPSYLGFASNYRKTNGSPAFTRSEGEPVREVWIDGGAVPLPIWQAYFRSLTNWSGPAAPQSPGRDILTALSSQDPNYEQLKEASAERPDCRFPIRYGDGPMTLVPHLTPLKRWIQFLRLRSVALLEEGRSDDALADVLLALRWSDGLRGEPILISHLVRIASDYLTLQPVWEGCRDRRWNESQLLTLQQVLDARDYVDELRRTLVGERVLSGVAYDNMVRGRSELSLWSHSGEVSDFTEDTSLKVFLTLMPRGWIRQSQVAHIRYVQALVDDLANARSHADLAPSGALLDQFISKKSLFNILAAMLAPSIDGASRRSYEMETWRQLAVTGLALERFRLVEGKYPASLEALTPRYVKEVPLDPMDGHPLRYRVEPDGQFRLYSVGRDHQDDGGVRPIRRAKSAADRERASDQVWR